MSIYNRVPDGAEGLKGVLKGKASKLDKRARSTPNIPRGSKGAVKATASRPAKDKGIATPGMVDLPRMHTSKHN
jgi:hypothetical protein